MSSRLNQSTSSLADGGVNVCAMANMNPLWFIDPYGLESITSGTRAGRKLRGALNHGSSYVQEAVNRIGEAAWDAVSYVGDGFDHVAILLSDFQWHGLWGGPNWTAGQSKPEQSLTKEDKRVGATDARDSAYKQHDIDIFGA